MSSFTRHIILWALLLLMSGCGYQLRGTSGGYSESLSHLSPLHLSGLGKTDELYQILSEYLRGSGVELTEQRQGAVETLLIYNHAAERKSYSFGGRGKVLEYELTERFAFKLGKERVDPSAPEHTIEVRKIYTNPETETLGRSQEEEVLWTELRQRAAQQLVQRLSKLTR